MPSVRPEARRWSPTAAVAIAVFAILAVAGAMGWKRWASQVITGGGSVGASLETPLGGEKHYYSFNQMRPDYYQATLLLRRDGSFRHSGKSLDFSGTYEIQTEGGVQTVHLSVKKESDAPNVRPGQVIEGVFTTLPVPGEGSVEGIQLFADFEVYLPMRSHEAPLAARLPRDAASRQDRAQDERALAERNRRNTAGDAPSSPSTAPSGPNEGYSGADTAAQATTEGSIDSLYQEGVTIISNVMLEAQTLMASGNGLDPGNLSNGIFDFRQNLLPLSDVLSRSTASRVDQRTLRLLEARPANF